MKQNKEQINVTTNEYDRELSLMLDLKSWIEEDDFEPPFPYNVLWDENNKTRNLRILAEAARRAYDSAIQNELNIQ